MDDKISKVNGILGNSNVDDEENVRRVKKESGLYERTECSKMLITEDNKLLLND